MAALFTQLDADLVSNLVELASSPDCPDDELVIDETKYLDGSAQDRHVYAAFDQGAWPACVKLRALRSGRRTRMM